MSLKQTNLLIFISFFPVFAFRSNLNFFEIAGLILIFILPILMINYFLFKKKLNNNLLKIYFAIIIIFGIDNNIGLWNGLIQPFRYILIDIFGIIYIPALILLILIIALVYFITKVDKKIYNVILVFIFTLFIFNIFDQTKSYKKIPNFVNSNEKKYEKTELVIIFDEMSGLNSFESLTKSGIEFNVLAKKFFQKHNFEFYSNINSLAANTVSSLSTLLNYSNDVEKIRNDTTKKSSNYFFNYEFLKSLFFEQFNDISIYQNMHINYCNFKNISRCESHNPFNKNKFLSGYKDTFFTKTISIWKINGSISSTFVWRLFRELRIIDSSLEPEGHKATFQNLFNKLEEDINSKNYDLIFVHTLVPHTPYGFNKDCNYDGSLSTLNRYFSIEDRVEQHNLERKCVLVYLDKFLEKLKLTKKIDYINLTIMSDHGSRITKEKNSSKSTIYAYKNSTTSYRELKDDSINQKVFSKRFN
jgi:hypothetical protein